MDINIQAVLVAALSSFLLGGHWYSPVLLLKPWSKAMNREGADDPHPARAFGPGFAFALAAAFVFTYLIGPEPDLRYALHMGLIVGAGLVAASFGINYQLADRPFAALFVDGGYHIGQFDCSD